MSSPEFNIACPIPREEFSQILLSHGGGGKLMHQLIEKIFFCAFDNEILRQGHDSAVFESPGKRLAYTTDSYVIRPLFFPGGDIGSLAVCGTVNDLAMSGARPVSLSCGFILEEGLSIETLWRIVQSMGETARRIGVPIVTGDTKVVDKGKGDGVFINTSGVGVLTHEGTFNPRCVQPGDAVIVSGDVGCHGMAVMAVREGLEFESTITSDCAPLWDIVADLIEEKITLHCLRDLTRGGLATTLNEIAKASGTEVAVEESRIPVREDVAAACEILGFDPFYVACEGRFVAFVKESDAARTVEVIRRHAPGQRAAQIGIVQAAARPLVTLKSRIGARRILDMPTAEQLPRIC